jgi:hypothetical protein
VFLNVAGRRPFGELGQFVFAGVFHNAKLFQAVAFFDFIAGEARFACVVHAGFGQIQGIVQVHRFLAQRACMVFPFHNLEFEPLNNFVQ